MNLYTIIIINKITLFVDLNYCLISLETTSLEATNHHLIIVTKVLEPTNEHTWLKNFGYALWPQKSPKILKPLKKRHFGYKTLGTSVIYSLTSSFYRISISNPNSVFGASVHLPNFIFQLLI